MTREEIKNELIIKFLKENGFKPRKEIKDFDSYLRQLKDRLKRNGKNLYIDETQNPIYIYIGDYTKKDKYNKKIDIKLSEEQYVRFKDLAKKRNTSLSNLVRDLLEREYYSNKK